MMDFIPKAFRPNRDRVTSVEDGIPDGRAPRNYQTTPSITTALQTDDKLSVYRHMVGIHSAISLAPTMDRPDVSHNNLHFDGRAAPNLGIYNRVVHREQESKKSYKLASLLINGSLGVQIIVAAALTAMGASSASHVGITIFGAINTVIAGILTYLKGSGLPNRLRYYENEWKKIREFIEQRERDFARPDCPLDVYEVVGVIEHMYEDVKADVQTNTPDSYVSVGDIRNRVTATNPQVPRMGGFGMGAGVGAGMHGAAGKLQELEMKYGHKVTEVLESLAHKEGERLRGFEKGLGKEVEAGRDRIFDVEKEAERDLAARGNRVVGAERDLHKEAEARVSNLVDMGRDKIFHAEKEAERDLAARGNRVVSAERDFHQDVEARVSNLMDVGRDVAREAERHRQNVSQIGRAVDDEIHSIGPQRHEER